MNVFPLVIPHHPLLFLSLSQAVRLSLSQPSTMALWQLKLINTYYSSSYSKAVLGKSTEIPLVQEEYLYGLKSRLDTVLDSWQCGGCRFCCSVYIVICLFLVFA